MDKSSFDFLRGLGPECTRTSRSQSLATFLANFHSQDPYPLIQGGVQLTKHCKTSGFRHFTPFIKGVGSKSTVKNAVLDTSPKLASCPEAFFTNYWCWRAEGAAPVKTSTVVINFLENTREVPETITSTGAKFWLRFFLSVLLHW